MTGFIYPGDDEEDTEATDLPAYRWDAEDREDHAAELIRRVQGADMVPHFTGGGVTLTTGYNEEYLNYRGTLMEVKP